MLPFKAHRPGDSLGLFSSYSSRSSSSSCLSVVGGTAYNSYHPRTLPDQLAHHPAARSLTDLVSPLVVPRTPPEHTPGLEALPGSGKDHHIALHTPPEPVPLAASKSVRMMSDERDDAGVGPSNKNRDGNPGPDPSRPRATKINPQKATLSRALQKANTAVQLDNAQNFEGAMSAYVEACELLQQVRQRTTADSDKRKLEAIYRTYVSRIDELDQMPSSPGSANKALPARPPSPTKLRNVEGEISGDDLLNITATRRMRSDRDDSSSPMHTPLGLSPKPRLREKRAFSDDSQDGPRPLKPPELASPRYPFSRSPARLRPADESHINLSEDAQVPLPLSTIGASSPAMLHFDRDDHAASHEYTSAIGPSQASNALAGHPREGGQNSWLDAIDESGGSTASSIRSRSPPLQYHAKHRISASENPELDFETPLDISFETISNDGGHDSERPDTNDSEDFGEGIISRVLQKVEEARERVRQTEMEAYGRDVPREKPWQRSNYEGQMSPGGFFDDDSSGDEEQILEKMTLDQDLKDYDYLRKPSTIECDPRSRTSAAAGGRHGQIGNISSEMKSSSLANKRMIHHGPMSKGSKPVAPPPTGSLPELPTARSSSAQSVRNRRLSGRNAGQLMIQTSNSRKPSLDNEHGPVRSHAGFSSFGDRVVPTVVADASRSTAAKSREHYPTMGTSSRDAPHLASPPILRGRNEADFASTRRSGSPPIFNLPKKRSSPSLQSRNVSLSNPDDMLDVWPATPAGYASSAKTPTMPAAPTPLTSGFRENFVSPAVSSFYLLDDGFQLPGSPGSPAAMSPNGPVPLEPCPNDVMLRPFWLMRCLYQTLVHPRGGFLSSKLFVPREAWKVKGVKLKNVEDKIAYCDHLTSALQRLSKVDTCDADAVLEEMQSLEGILEQTQNILSRKLGSEVGVHSSGVLFKEAPQAMDADGVGSVPRAGSVSGKSSTFSWRRLRSKNSNIGLAGTTNSRNGGPDGGKEAATLPTLPMTSKPTSRPPKRDIGLAQFTGPNAHYMGSLARLFDAAQVIDEIARQVDDPGLRHADKTQVGLELCTRHAAEFFGFYICRFALADLGLLLDKYVKRGTEWLLS